MEVYESTDDDDYCYSDHDDSIEAMENDSSGFHCSSSKTATIKVITRDSLLSAQKADLRRVMELLSLGEHDARTLLIHFRWDVEQLSAVFVERGKSYLFGAVGISSTDHRNADVPFTSTSMLSCDICMEELSGEKMTRMGCSHYFCNECWTKHFIVKIKEGQSKRIRCMAHKCNAVCDEAIVRNLVSKKHPDLAAKFERFLLESYIEDNKLVKWCPSTPHCGNAIRIEEDEICEVECSCGLQFCFTCLSETHSPCSCFMWKLWTKKCRDESETVNWITVHTKPCPKCFKPVEKNGGCNLVSCVCGQAFCWLCGAATGREHTWSRISGHSCGRYKEDQEKKTERAKRDLYRYMHYHNRYKAHTDSFKLESKLKESIREKVTLSEEKKSNLRDFSWVMTGLNRLFRSRRVLSYSYPFAYYMFGDELFNDEMSENEREIKKNLFENQQQQLESNVEKLSKYLEEPFDQYTDEKVMEIRMQIINLSVITDTLCLKMYECIENDLLGSLKLSTHSIAPYMSRGVERASELTSTRCPRVNVCDEVGEGKIEMASGSMAASVDREYGPQKRAKKGAGLFFDLNLPAEV